ncbi:5862_t:CDS:2, partial [Racocetra persica]
MSCNESRRGPSSEQTGNYVPDIQQPSEQTVPDIQQPSEQIMPDIQQPIESSRWLRETGTFVKDYRVSERQNLKYQLRENENDFEFTHIRYTACTCKPDNFVRNKFTLRQRQLEYRETEIFIAVTMYDEEGSQLSRTFNAIAKNIYFFYSQNEHRTWKKIVICIIADGRKRISKSSLNYLSSIGVYKKGIAVDNVVGRKVEAHIFEYTTVIPVKDKIIPIQVIFCLKEKNTKKINSHRWIFNAFSPILNPKICVLLDVGTVPGENAIYDLWNIFRSNEEIAGACGEIVAMREGGGWKKWIYKLIWSAQNFEYKMSNILDKPLEHVLGYITVLPGAFSAYRYSALENTKDENDNDEGPLVSYFKDQPIKGFIKSIVAANMYLAEDHVPEEISGFISQRRRWLNGTFFASLYAISHFYNIWRNLIPLPWNPSISETIFVVLRYVYFILVTGQFILSMSNRPQSWGNRETDEDDELDQIIVSCEGEMSQVSSLYRQENIDTQQENEDVQRTNKGNDAKKIEEFRKKIRAYFVLIWLICNASLVFSVIASIGTLEQYFSQGSIQSVYIAVIL